MPRSTAAGSIVDSWICLPQPLRCLRSTMRSLSSWTPSHQDGQGACSQYGDARTSPDVSDMVTVPFTVVRMYAGVAALTRPCPDRTLDGTAGRSDVRYITSPVGRAQPMRRARPGVQRRGRGLRTNRELGGLNRELGFLNRGLRGLSREFRCLNRGLGGLSREFRCLNRELGGLSREFRCLSRELGGLSPELGGLNRELGRRNRGHAGRWAELEVKKRRSGKCP